jgi:cytochrome c peroxidase
MNHKHNCEHCQTIGTIKDSEFKRTYDLYYCEIGAKPTVIARYGSEPHEYMSGMASAMCGVYPLSVALSMATEKDIITH